METTHPVLTRGTRVQYTGNNPGRQGWKGEVVDASTGRIPDGFMPRDYVRVRFDEEFGGGPTIRVLRSTLEVVEAYTPAVCEECGGRAERQPMSRTYAIDHHPDCTEGKPAPVPGGEEAF